MERVAGDVLHHAQRERHDRPQAEVPERDLHEAERDDGAERDEGAGLRRFEVRCAKCDGVDQPAGEQRHEQVGHGGADHGKPKA